MKSDRLLDSFTLLLSLIITISLAHSFTFAAPPKAVSLMKEVRSRPFHQQKKIYQTILKDTSVLTHKGLIQALVETGREGWFKNYLYPELHLPEQQDPSAPDNVRIPLVFGTYQDVLSRIPNNALGHQVLELKMYLTANTMNWDNMLARQIKKDPRTIRLFVKKGPNKRFNPNKNPKEKSWKLLAGGFFFNQVLYETYRYNRSNLPDDWKKQMVRWARSTLKAKDSIFALEIPAVNILHLEGYSLREIKTMHNVDLKAILNDKEEEIWTKKKLRKRLFNKAKNWRSDYPRWPITQSNSNTGTKGPGHKNGKKKAQR